MDPDEIVMPVIDELSTSAIANIDVAGSQNINNFSATVNVMFNEAVNNANYNVSVILTEDDLSNPSENWNQSNGYSLSQVHMGGFEFFSTDAPSYFWPYNHVGRLLIGGFNGVNIVQGDVDNGTSITHDFDAYNLPLGWNKDKLKVIAVLTDSNGEVVNVISKKYEEVLSSDIPTNTNEWIEESIVKTYPNPTTGLLTIDLNLKETLSGSLQLRNLLGQSVLNQRLDAFSGNQQIELNLASLSKGVYMLQVEFDNNRINKKITVQ